jgi:hypothetical protein
MSRIPGISAAIASGFVLVSSAGVIATQAPAPAVAVAGFVVDSDSRLSAEATDAMTDKLAIDLVESGRFRVLDRAWLGGEALSVQRSPIARIRDAATAAGVDFLIVGRVATVSLRQRYARPGPRILSPIGRPFAGYAQANPRLVSRGSDYLRVSLEVLDTKTGSILTETSSTCPVPPRSAPRVTPLVLLPVSPVAAAAAAIAHSRKGAASLDPGIERAVTATGQVIARWSPPASNNR